MDAEKLQKNLGTLIATLVRMKPSTAKGIYVRSVAVSSTMGPGVRIDTLEAQRYAESM
jgi:large subunit ribosomal protein L1